MAGKESSSDSTSLIIRGDFMSRNNRNKFSKVLAGIVLCSLIFSLSGCNSSKKTDKKVISVIIEPSFQQMVQEAADYMMEKNPDVKIEIQQLSTREEEREMEIQKLRTQIMAGKGADVYLLNATSDGAAKLPAPLFENPYKTMQSGALASLDKYMEKDSYWEDGTYKKEILLAGQHKDKQYIIPLSCDYSVLATTETERESMQGETLPEWLEQVEGSSDAELKQAFFNLQSISGGSWFEPAVDYENQKVLFDREGWKKFALDFLAFKQKCMETGVDENAGAFSIVKPLEVTGQAGKVQIIPDIMGRKMACVRSFGAVGMSCAHKEEAYQFLMLFLNNDMQSEMEKQDKNSMVQGVIDMEMPVQDSAIVKRLEALGRSVQEVEVTLEEFRTLESAYFPTNVEVFLYSEVEKANSLLYEPETDINNQWEKMLSETAEKAWQDYNTQVSE